MKKKPPRDPIAALEREVRAARRVGQGGQCHVCGEQRPLALIPGSKPTICAACQGEKRGHSLLDNHHPARKANDPTTIPVPVNDQKLRTVRREDVILPEKTLGLLERNVGGFIKQREQLKKLGLPIKKGLLFYGPPGTGKTHTIHYLASQLPDHTTLLITSEQVAYLDHYFQLARFLQPAMIVIEDVDLIARKREEMSGPCDESLLNKLLNEMDGLREDAAVLFVLTTNRPEHLEVALASRPGRIDQAIEFPLPDDQGRRQLIRLYACGLALADEVVEVVVKKTKHASAAFIKELMRRSAQYCIHNGGDNVLKPQALDAAIEEMLFTGGSLNAKLLGALGVAREPAL